MCLCARDFAFELDERLIAQHPLPNRDESRLMRLDRTAARLDHHVFGELPHLLRAGDLLVVNDTRVVPAKFSCLRRTGAAISGLFLREITEGRWEVMLKNAGRCRPGEQLALKNVQDVTLVLAESLGQGRYVVAVSPPSSAESILQTAGSTPLPPYIHRPAGREAPEDSRRYQTIYAARPGAVAAPTAGLHFTDQLLSALEAVDVQIARLTLHVGLGTFQPVSGEDLAAHRMHAEWYDLPVEAAEAINAAKLDARRIVAVGTTSVRVLETVARRCLADGRGGLVFPETGWTDIFLYPPAEFHAIDALITNFHLPRSTLLMLVAAFCSPGRTTGLRTILDAYAEAVAHRYRFYSYGEAMLIE